MSKAPNLAAALADAGGSTRRKPAPPLPAPMSEAESRGQAANYQQPGRAGTKPITVHFPEDVRSQLKLVALERRTTLHNLMAEALNDLFAKYGKPEIAPTERATQ